MSVIHDQICRLCAEINQSTEDILENNLKEMAELIYRYLSITVDTFASISTKICLDCKEKILNFHNFALKCEHVQSFLIKHKTYANYLDDYRKLKIEFDLQFGIKQEDNKEEECEQFGIKDEKDISDVDYFDEDVGSLLLNGTKIKSNPESNPLKKTTLTKKRKRITRLSSRKLKTSKGPKSEKSNYEIVNDNEKDEITINKNMININKRRTSKRCKSNIFQTLITEDEKMDNTENNEIINRKMTNIKVSSPLQTKEENSNDNMKKTVDDNNADDLNNIKESQNDEIIINGNVINVNKPIQDVATVKEILKLSEYNEIDIKKLELPRFVLKKARISQMFNYDCHLCEIKFDEWRLLSVHTKEQHQARAEVKCICFKTLRSWPTIKAHFTMHNPEESGKIRCDQCFKVLISKQALKNHMYTHSRESKIYGCDQCNKKFFSPIVAKKHKKIHEPAEKRYKFECPLCDKKFAQNFFLNNHINVVHKKIKCFTCDVCGSSYATKNQLNSHSFIHQEEITCMCDICDRGFKNKYVLREHLKVHRNITYPCPHCSKVFKNKSSYRNHLHLHDEYPKFSCPFCDKKFKSPKNMNSHKRIHTGERPYSCPWCPKTFTQPSNFKMHKVQAHEIEFREYERKILKDQEEYAKKLREKLTANSSKTDMANNVPVSDEKALKINNV